MLSPDYQEFANRGAAGYPWQYRDFTSWHERSDRNRPGVAGLPRKTSTKAELSACRRAQMAFCAAANAFLTWTPRWRSRIIRGSMLQSG